MVGAAATSVYHRATESRRPEIIAETRFIGAFALFALAFASDQGAAVAAPFDFLFSGQRPASRSNRARRPPPRPVVAVIPLPVPRPHFPGERSAQPSAARPAEPAKPADAPKPAEQPIGGKPAPENNATTEPSRPPAAAPNVKSSPAPASALPAQPPTPPPKPPDIAKPASAAPPAVAPSGATTAFTPRAPDDDAQCPGRLAARRVAVEPTAIGPQPDPRCTIVEPVRLTELTLADGGKVAFPDHPTIACTTADAFSVYVRDLLVPLAKGTFGSPIAAVWTGPGLECRSRDSVFGAKLSAHGQGLAIDIAQLKLADGRMIEVGEPKTDAETGFETASRAGACGYFHTVLGPGSDAYHRTHWHFDLEVRGAKGDSKYCK